MTSVSAMLPAPPTVTHAIWTAGAGRANAGGAATQPMINSPEMRSLVRMCPPGRGGRGSLGEWRSRPLEWYFRSGSRRACDADGHRRRAAGVGGLLRPVRLRDRRRPVPRVAAAARGAAALLQREVRLLCVEPVRRRRRLLDGLEDLHLQPRDPPR